MNQQINLFSGMFTTALRLVVGWTYFSAFWRRLVLENKLNPDEAGYIGEKFNHFLPHALGIKPMIEYMVTHPDVLWWSMVAFTIIEGVVGLIFMLGLFTRLSAFGVLCLALGILLGSGWIGTTCLDEWQIGSLGVAGGFTIFFTGGGRYSMDQWLMDRKHSLAKWSWFGWLGSGALSISEKAVNRIVLIGSLGIFGLTLYTNQYFHGGVYGKLHNKSVRPHVVISDAVMHDSTLQFKVYRDEGADVYGSFLIGVNVKDERGFKVFEFGQQQLSSLSPNQIKNDYVAKVKPGKHSLIIPLGAKANLMLTDTALLKLNGQYTVELVDISGAVWTQPITVGKK
ncbi:MAG: DoxX family membrane protein [Saprospiraceae bacterium]|nr:DoxX family membrane protein [Saprospiraceae bacterium]HQU95493.1 TQO small subunit DoxD [Saprospiraceae bacterium]